MQGNQLRQARVSKQIEREIGKILVSDKVRDLIITKMSRVEGFSSLNAVCTYVCIYIYMLLLIFMLENISRWCRRLYGL